MMRDGMEEAQARKIRVAPKAPLAQPTLLWPLLLAAVVVIAAAVAAWSVVRDRSMPVANGTMVAVTLASGPIFYGRLASSKSSYLNLTEIYYVESFTDANGRRDNRLINRKKNDWHAPDWMSIPLDRVALIEPVTPESRLGMLIAQERKTP